MAVLFNFPEINERATTKQVRQFFNDDVEQLQKLAGLSLRSITMDNIGGGHSNHLNSYEHGLIKAVEARQELKLIKQAINDCPAESKQLLTARYINHFPLFRIAMDDGYSRATLQRRFNSALLEFAYRYLRQGRNLLVSEHE